MKKLYILICLLLCLGIGTTKAQFNTILTFNDTNGALNGGSLTLSGSVLYGMTWAGGGHGLGCVYSINTNGTGYKDIMDFNGFTGAFGQYGTLVLSGNQLFGMTYWGGTYDSGVIFTVRTDGSGVKILHNFNYHGNGFFPYGSLILSGSTLFGVTSQGGTSYEGGIFSIDTNGTGYKVLRDNDTACRANWYGYLAISGTTLYGMGSGIHDSGNIFSINTNGTGFTKLFKFNGPNGHDPNGSLTISGTTLYGMTFQGGTNQDGVVFSINTNGTGYKKLHDFTGLDGAHPWLTASLALSGSTLFGMTLQGGTMDSGVVFSINTNGSGYKKLHDFVGPNGSSPIGGVSVSGNMLYGLTVTGGARHYGIIFGLNYVTAGVDELNSNSDNTVKVFPNPSNGRFTIQLANSPVRMAQPGGQQLIANSSVEVYNMLGEKIYEETLRQAQGGNTIDLSNNANGIYLYRVIANTGEPIGEGKLIIEK